jgi:hypothetical protein
MKKKQYTIFFANLYEAWFERFPERAVLFGDPTNSPLSPEQEQQLGNAWYQQLKNRFNNLFRSTKAGRQSKAEANDVQNSSSRDVSGRQSLKNWQ